MYCRLLNQNVTIDFSSGMFGLSGDASTQQSLSLVVGVWLLDMRGSHLTRNHKGKRFVLARGGGIRFYFEV